jgi:DNA-binding PadR family transcriptional regulator
VYVDILILSQLKHQDKHGYEIKKGAERILGDVYKINNNSLYPVLRHFEEMGAISKRVQAQEGKPNRHIYKITPVGEEILGEMLKDYPDELHLNDYEFFTRVGLFDLIEREEREIILQKRKDALEKQKRHLTEIIRERVGEINHRHPYKQDILELICNQRDLEIGWIDRMLSLEGTR